MFDNAIPRSIRSVTKWAIEIFHEWGIRIVLKNNLGFKFDLNKVQDLNTNVAE